jgi:PIN domain nuclease of toxin-antitoxin system
VLLLDTNALIWFAGDARDLGAAARERVDHALYGTGVSVSSFSYWEIALLASKRRLALLRGVRDFRAAAVRRGIAEIPVDSDIGIGAVALAGLHSDPADRIIVATALAHDATLITADERLLAWRGPLKTHDARR